MTAKSCATLTGRAFKVSKKKKKRLTWKHLVFECPRFEVIRAEFLDKSSWEGPFFNFLSTHYSYAALSWGHEEPQKPGWIQSAPILHHSGLVSV